MPVGGTTKITGLVHNTGRVLPRINNLSVLAALFDFGPDPLETSKKLGLVVEGSYHDMAPLPPRRVIAMLPDNKAPDGVGLRVNLGHRASLVVARPHGVGAGLGKLCAIAARQSSINGRKNVECRQIAFTPRTAAALSLLIVSTELPPNRPDTATATKVQILATEHWSLLATRSLTYTEVFARVNIFLAILSGAVIALALVAQADHFGPVFIGIAIPVLLVVFFSGLVTVSRLNALNRDDYRWVIGMNRLRNAYLTLHPELEPHFTTSPYDDLAGALQTLGIDVAAAGKLGSLAHLPNTLPFMLTVIVAAVAAAILALITLAIAIPAWAIALTAAVGFVVTLVLMAVLDRRSMKGLTPSLQPRFPTPGR